MNRNSSKTNGQSFLLGKKRPWPFEFWIFFWFWQGKSSHSIFQWIFDCTHSFIHSFIHSFCWWWSILICAILIDEFITLSSLKLHQFQLAPHWWIYKPTLKQNGRSFKLTHRNNAVAFPGTFISLLLVFIEVYNLIIPVHILIIAVTNRTTSSYEEEK